MDKLLWLRYRTVISLLATMGWMVFIFYLSTPSAALIVKKFSFLKQVFGDSVQYPAHFFLYFVLFQLAKGVFIHQEQGNKMRQVGLITTLIFTCFYGVMDEFYQSTVPFRSFQLRDILVDCLAAFSGFIIELKAQKG